MRDDEKEKLIARALLDLKARERLASGMFSAMSDRMVMPKLMVQPMPHGPLPMYFVKTPPGCLRVWDE